jgi:hypothetical protein
LPYLLPDCSKAESGGNAYCRFRRLPKLGFCDQNQPDLRVTNRTFNRI